MDSRHRHILDLDRRGLLRGATALAALAALGPARAQTVAEIARDPFTLGVASGDPWPDGVVLWTRLAPEPLAAMGGLLPVARRVGWEVAGLAPARPYWYRFRAGAAVSPTGRTRTAPAPGATPDRFRIVNSDCQHWEHGHFTAWRHIAEEPELDAIFHYGDYIYEYAGRQPGSRGWGPVVRSHAGAETYTLENYRQRYAQYHTDPDLMAGQVTAEDGTAVASEFTAPSLTSEGDGSEIQNSTPEILRRNPHIAFFNNRRGYTLHEATPERMETVFRAFPFVTRPDAPREDKARFVQETGQPTLHRA